MLKVGGLYTLNDYFWFHKADSPYLIAQTQPEKGENFLVLGFINKGRSGTSYYRVLVSSGEILYASDMIQYWVGETI
jgi:hypothetical protein